MDNNLVSSSNLTDTGEINSLDKAIQNSKESVNNEELKKETKKRGRPKSGKTTKTSTDYPTNGNGDMELVKYNRSQYEMALRMVFTLSGNYLAAATKFEDFKLSEDELSAVCSQGSVVCEQFIPPIQSKYIALGGFALVTFGIYGTKMMAYNNHVKALEAARKKLEGDTIKD